MAMVDDSRERLARVEERVVAIQGQNTEALKAQRAMQEALERVEHRLSTIDEDIVRYKGLFGGVFLVLSAIAALAVYFKGFVLSKLGIPQ